MRKWLVLAVLAVVAVALARLAAGKRQEGGHHPTMWEKMEAAMAEMPEDFPPRVMFDNVAATKEDTGRILEILEKGNSTAAQGTEGLAVAGVPGAESD